MNLKEKMRRGDFCIGPFLKAGSPEIVEVSGYAGVDFVLLDMEHGPLAYETIEHRAGRRTRRHRTGGPGRGDHRIGGHATVG